MTNIEPEIIEYDDSFMRKMNCLYDIFNSLIKCVYVYTINSHLHFLTLEESGNSILEDDDIDLDGNALVDFSYCPTLTIERVFILLTISFNEVVLFDLWDFNDFILNLFWYEVMSIKKCISSRESASPGI